MNRTLPTVIIPASNEVERISNTLAPLSLGVGKKFEVIVVCNGCVDGTFNLIRRDYPAVTLLSLDFASKTSAIQRAEILDPGFPRIYLDADVILAPAHLDSLIATATDNNSNLVVPSWQYDPMLTNKVVNIYYSEWRRSNFVKQFGYGAGCYVLSKSARARFRDWPSVINDDGFLRTLFTVDQIQILDHAYTVVTVPTTIGALIKIKSRSKFGNRMLQREFVSVNKVVRHIPRGFLAGLVYTAINIAATSGDLAMRYLTGFKWLRDR